MNYRFDKRTKEEFEKDIKERTLLERSLFIAWLDLVEKETGSRPEFTDTGCGKDGELLEDKDVNTNPDFHVDGYGKVEVKFANPMIRKFFHLKINQVKSYVKKDATILMINGAGEEIPEFTMIKKPALERIMSECKEVPWAGFGYKPSYKIPVDQFIWRPLV